MNCNRHPEYKVKNIFGECDKCAEEEREDYKKMKESITEGLKKYGILKIVSGED